MTQRSPSTTRENPDRSGLLGELARERAEAVTVRDHAVGHPKPGAEHVDAQQVARLGPVDRDRPGDDVRPEIGIVRQDRRDLDRVREHVVFSHTVLAEPPCRAGRELFEDPFVRHRVDRDHVARRDPQHRSARAAGKEPQRTVSGVDRR